MERSRPALWAALAARVRRGQGRPSVYEARRRRWVVAVTLVVGTVVLGAGLAQQPGDDLFLVFTFLVAGIWATGALLSGPLHLGWARSPGGGRTRPVVQPLVLGAIVVAVFCAGALIVAQVPLLRESATAVLEHARYAPLPVVALMTLVNGIAEELFFRGALFDAVGRHHAVLVTTVLYVLVTTATGNVMLVFAAAVLGTLVGLQRRVSGGILAPIITHLTWSLSMLFVLPPLLTTLG